MEWKGEVSHLYRDTVDEKEKKEKKATSWLVKEVANFFHQVAKGCKQKEFVFGLKITH